MNRGLLFIATQFALAYFGLATAEGHYGMALVAFALYAIGGLAVLNPSVKDTLLSRVTKR